MGAEESKVKVLPEDVGRDAAFGLQLINLMQLSSAPSAPLMLSEDGERQGFNISCIWACLQVFSVCVSEGVVEE